LVLIILWQGKYKGRGFSALAESMARDALGLFTLLAPLHKSGFYHKRYSVLLLILSAGMVN